MMFKAIEHNNSESLPVYVKNSIKIWQRKRVLIKSKKSQGTGIRKGGPDYKLQI